jgi:tetratricopeptide (TPR) repeat protein
MRKKDLDGAKKDFDQAISLDPKSTTAMNLRAGYYREMKEYDLALKDLDEIVRLEPNNVTGYFNRGKFYMDRKDKEHAIADLNKASTLDVERRYKVPISGMLRRLEMMD